MSSPGHQSSSSVVLHLALIMDSVEEFIFSLHLCFLGHLTSKMFLLSCPPPPTESLMPNGPESQPCLEVDGADKEEEGSEDEWEQVGPRNKTSITRQADFVRTPITDIFGGHIRYVDRLL